MLKSYAGNSNSIADSVLSILFDSKLASEVSKNAVKKVKDKYNWDKIADSTYYVYQLAISQTVKEKQEAMDLQINANKTGKVKNIQKELGNLLAFRKRSAYA